MRSRFRPACLGLAALLALSGVGPAPASPGPETPTPDLPFKRFPGARLVDHSTRAFDEYWVPLGRLVGDGQAAKHQVLVGRWIHAAYALPQGRSVAEVYRHYEQELARAGFEVVYACQGTECGEGGRKTNGDWWTMNDNRRFVAARLSRNQGDLWVSVHVHARKATAPVRHEVDVVETRPPVVPPPPRNEADVATLEKELKADGRVVLRGLEFVEGRPALRPESEGVVQAIAELLARDPGLRLHVVVHSDYQATAPASLDLTRKRAAALVTLLTRRHQVPSDRLQAAGLGPLAPVASHATEEGRAMNRRVELVPQGGERGREAAARVRGEH